MSTMCLKETAKGSGVWRGDVWCKGRRTKLTFRGPANQAHLYEAKRRLEIEAAGGIVNGKEVTTFKSFVDTSYSPAAEVELRASTWSRRKHQLKDLTAHFGPLKLTKISEKDVEAYKIKRRKTVGPVTTNNELMSLSAVLTYARDGLKVPCAKPRIKRCKVPKGKRGKVQFFSRGEVGAILAECAAEYPKFLPLVWFLFETGCRKSEAINLTWSRVDFEAGQVRIWNETEEGEGDTAGDDDAYEVKSVEREVPMSDALALVLKERKLAGLSREWVFPVTEQESKGQRFVEFPKYGWIVLLKKATERLQEAAREAGAPVPPALTGGPHKARHTFASHFLAGNPDLFLLGQIMGHHHTRVTELYAHLVPGHLERARNVVTFDAPPVSVKKSAAK